MSSKSLPELLMVQGVGNPLFTVCRQGAFLVARKNRGLPGLVCYSFFPNSFIIIFFVYSGHLLLPASHSSMVLLGISKSSDIFCCVSPAFNRASFISFIFSPFRAGGSYSPAFAFISSNSSWETISPEGDEPSHCDQYRSRYLSSAGSPSIRQIG